MSEYGKPADPKPTSVPFREEDALRAARLREEIVARATELSLIMARTLEIQPPRDLRQFQLTDGPNGEVLATSVFRTSGGTTGAPTVEIITWGCTCHTNKICCADPDCPPCP